MLKDEHHYKGLDLLIKKVCKKPKELASFIYDDKEKTFIEDFFAQ